MMLRPRALIAAVLAVLLLQPACVHTFREVKPREISRETPGTGVSSPLKVHLVDGRVALFPEGASFAPDSIRGAGWLYEISLRPDTAGAFVRAISLADVAALETYDQRTRPVESLVASAAATGATIFGSALALVAIFGSCPTIYTDVDGVRLQAEAFPNSIVPLFEMRDVDLLQLPLVDEDTLELEVRNEALETHYINHMELLEVVHPVGTEAVPDNDGIVRLMSNLRPPDRAVDSRGRDIVSDVAERDERTVASPSQALAGGALKDHVDLTVTSPGPDTATALYLRLRNSLLGSVFFYDQMLDAQGANALNWLSEELNSVSGAIKLGGFYKEHMGLRIEILEEGAYREVGRVREVGPIAFDHVVVPLPASTEDSLRVRLRFITDAWRIDHVAVGTLRGYADVRSVPAAGLRGERWDVADILHPDEDYAITSASDRFWVNFPLSDMPSDSARTLLLATQGYYTEWIRGKWVQDDVRGEPFEPTVASLQSALERWRVVKDDFEATFDATKIPVR